MQLVPSQPDTAVKNFNEERENNPSKADKNLLSRTDMTGFFFYLLDLAKDKPSNKFESLEDMGSEISRNRIVLILRDLKY